MSRPTQAEQIRTLQAELAQMKEERSKDKNDILAAISAAAQGGGIQPYVPAPAPAPAPAPVAAPAPAPAPVAAPAPAPAPAPMVYAQQLVHPTHGSHVAPVPVPASDPIQVGWGTASSKKGTSVYFLIECDKPKWPNGKGNSNAFLCKEICEKIVQHPHQFIDAIAHYLSIDAANQSDNPRTMTATEFQRRFPTID